MVALVHRAASGRTLAEEAVRSVHLWSILKGGGSRPKQFTYTAFMHG